MTGSLRLSALLLLLLSRLASADLEKGEDEFVRSWVIIEEQLVPPSRDDPLVVGGGGGSVGGVGGGGRRITPKSVFVAPSFNKCSDGYQPDSMGRCVKVVKLNQAAQWDFLLKQLNSMYGGQAGGGAFPMPAAPSAYQTAAPAIMTTTTAEPPSQKTDSPGPFQLNIPFGGADPSSKPSSAESAAVDEHQAATTSTATTPTASTVATTAGPTTTVAVADDVATTVNPAGTTTVDPPMAGEDADDADVTTIAVPAETTGRPRPYRNRGYQTTTEDDDVDATTVTTTPYDPQPYPTTAATNVKTKYVDNTRTSTVGTGDLPKTVKTGAGELPTSLPPPTVVTTTAAAGAETEEPITGVTVTTTEADDEEDVVTVLAVAATADTSRPGSPTRLPYTTGDGGTQTAAADTTTPEFYDDQPEEPTAAPEVPDCSAPNAHRYYAACADFQLQQLQVQQQQLLLHQHQQQQQQVYQQQQQQFYQQQQQQFHHLQQQQQPQHNHVAAALVKRPAAGAGVQVRFPGDGRPASAAVAASEITNHVRFPGSGPYRTTNKMYESSRHPTWWPTGWPDQQQQQSEDPVRQQHRLQHHLPQQKPEVRLWEFGSRLPKTTTTTAAPHTAPPSPTQWFHRFF